MTIVLFVWRVAVLIKLTAAARFAWTGSIRRFPFVFVWLAGTGLRSLVLMFGPWPRHEVYAATSTAVLALEFAASVEVFHEATKVHEFGRAASWILAIAAVIGGASAFLGRLLLVPPVLYGIEWTLLAERHASEVATVALGLGLLLTCRLRSFGARPEEMSFRALLVMFAYSFGSMLFSGANVATHFRYPLLTNLLPVIFDGCLSATWGSWVLAARHIKAPVRNRPAPGMLEAVADQMDQREAGLRRLRRAVLTVR